MTIEGVNIDVRMIAEGIYRLFGAEQIVVCAFGMLPANIMEPLKRMLGEKIEEIAKDSCQRLFGFRPECDCASDDWKQGFVSEALRQIVVEIYNVADENNALAV